MPDIRAENHGSIWLVHTPSPAGREWVSDNVAVQQWFGRAAVIEWRYMKPIIDGARGDGLEVEVDGRAFKHSIDNSN